MRLIKAEFSGFGRLAEAQINLDHKVVAIVGPNEAGKIASRLVEEGLAFPSSDAVEVLKAVHDELTAVLDATQP